MKFTAYEAEGISGFVSNSPLMSWVYQLFSKGQFSVILGIAELLTAALIAARPISPRFSAVGSVFAVGMFLTTLTFLFSTHDERLINRVRRVVRIADGTIVEG